MKILFLLAFLVIFPSIGGAQGFAPTWKLLSSSQKEQFVAGYLQGYRDASKVTEVTLEFVRENPTKAQEGLATLKTLYDVDGVRPAILVGKLDQYFGAAENQSASFSQAVTAVK